MLCEDYLHCFWPRDAETPSRLNLIGFPTQRDFSSAADDLENSNCAPRLSGWAVRHAECQYRGRSDTWCSVIRERHSGPCPPPMPGTGRPKYYKDDRFLRSGPSRSAPPRSPWAFDGLSGGGSHWGVRGSPQIHQPNQKNLPRGSLPVANVRYWKHSAYCCSIALGRSQS